MMFTISEITMLNPISIVINESLNFYSVKIYVAMISYLCGFQY